MDDHELLKLAAKAAGLTDWYWSHADKTIKLRSTDVGHEGPEPLQWNPLDDDSDALRLAVQLRISVMQPAPEDNGNVLALWACGHGVSEIRSSNPYAATRRAIVRAAAAIGVRNER